MTGQLILTWGIFREHENYLKLELKYDGPYKFSGVGTHLGSGETFEIIEGEVNKRTKYWKFIALYENSLKKVKGKMNEKRLVQVPYNIMTHNLWVWKICYRTSGRKFFITKEPSTCGLILLDWYIWSCTSLSFMTFHFDSKVSPLCIRFVQYWGWSHGQVWCGGYHDQESNYMDKKLRPYVDQCFLYPLTENWQSPV